MKRIIFLTILLASSIFTVSCSVISSRDTTTLPPLPTTGITDKTARKTVSITYPEEYVDTSLANSNLAKLDQDYLQSVDTYFNFYYSGDIILSHTALIDFGHLWCDVMRQGMTQQDVTERIYEGAIDQNDSDTHFAIIFAAVDHYCYDQKYKWP